MTWPSAEVITALGGVIVLLVGALTKSVATLVRVLRRLEASAADASAHVGAVFTQVTEGQIKLEEINAKTTKTLENTDGSLGRVIEHAGRLQSELEHLRQREEVRVERERVMGQMLSELTTTLAASQAALAKAGPGMPGGRRASDREEKG